MKGQKRMAMNPHKYARRAVEWGIADLMRTLRPIKNKGQVPVARALSIALYECSVTFVPWYHVPFGWFKKMFLFEVNMKRWKRYADAIGKLDDAIDMYCIWQAKKGEAKELKYVRTMNETSPPDIVVCGHCRGMDNRHTPDCPNNKKVHMELLAGATLGGIIGGPIGGDSTFSIRTKENVSQ